MKTVRVFVICLLTAAVLAAICAPSVLQGLMPETVVSAAAMDEFPLLGTCSRIAQQLLTAIRGQEHITLGIVTNALGDHFADELLSLVVVAMITIPVSLILGALLYKPLYEGAGAKVLLYISLNLCSVMIAWIIYRQFYFRLLIEGLIQKYITDQTLQTAVNYVTQLASAALVGGVAIKIALAVVAARVVLGKILMPVIGTFIRTLLFAFLTAQIMLLHANPAEWNILVPMMLVTLIVSGISDGIFGS